MTVGFLGVGTMGLPMAGRLLSAGVPLCVWDRTPARCQPLVARGAIQASSVEALFEASATVMVMLLHHCAVDATLRRGMPAFANCVSGRTLVLLGTTSADYSLGLEADVRRHGGRYVEAPVSGSQGPAEDGTLIGMTAGDTQAVSEVTPLLHAFCREVVDCGQVPSALRLKLAVNHYLIVLVAALAEATKAAAAIGVDMETFRRVLDAGPMGSAVSRAKLHKLVTGDFSPQAAIRDVVQIAHLVQQQAHAGASSALLIDAAAGMFAKAQANGLSDLDMAAVLESIASPKAT